MTNSKKPRGRSGRAPRGNTNAAKDGAEVQMRVRATSPETLEQIKAMTPTQRGEAAEQWLAANMKRFTWPTRNITTIAVSRNAAIESAVAMHALTMRYLKRGETPLTGDELKRALEAEEPVVSEITTNALDS